MYKLLIIDDEPLVQVGLRSMIQFPELEIEICGVADNGQSGLELIEKEQPDIVLTDIKMPVMTGLEMIRKCRETYGYTYPAFLILTSYEDFNMAKEAISYQIVDYLVKLELSPDLLRKSLEKAISFLQENTKKTEKNPSFSSSELQGLKEKFFVRLLHNLYDSEEQFDSLRQDLAIPFSFKEYQCCYFELIGHDDEQMDLQKQIVLYSNSFHLMQDITNKYNPAYFVALDKKHGAIIFLYDEEALSDTTFSTKETLRQVAQTLYNYYSVRLLCGIGNRVTEPLSIADSYQAARQAFRNTDSDSPISDINEANTEVSSKVVFNISVIKNDLTKAFSEYDAELLSQIITDMIQLFQEHSAGYVQALDGACNLLFLSISLLPNGEDVLSELFSDDEERYRSIYRQKTTEQVISWLTVFRDRLCEFFRSEKKEHKHHVVENVKKYIDSHITGRLSLNDVSNVYGISPSYLSSLFKKYNDMGYSEYVTFRKISTAKQMMSEGNLRIYEIADSLGFESAFYFSKVFKKVEGISPTDYMNSRS